MEMGIYFITPRFTKITGSKSSAMFFFCSRMCSADCGSYSSTGHVFLAIFVPGSLHDLFKKTDIGVGLSQDGQWSWDLCI